MLYGTDCDAISRARPFHVDDGRLPDAGGRAKKRTRGVMNAEMRTADRSPSVRRHARGVTPVTRHSPRVNLNAVGRIPLIYAAQLPLPLRNDDCIDTPPNQQAMTRRIYHCHIIFSHV